MAWEKEFLKLAAVMLACRWHVFNGPLQKISWAMLGVTDYTMEMELILEEVACQVYQDPTHH
jgi:hypothetical protein